MEERLRKFAHLIDAGSYTQASRDLHISQPALSAAINKLERELHAQLVLRNRNALKLTKAGRLAYDSAKELGVVSNNLVTRIADLLQQQPSISIGMTDSVAAALFASSESVEELEKQTKLSIIVNNSRYLADAIQRDEIDIAFITDKPAHSGGIFISEHVANEPFVLVGHPSIVESADRAIKRGELPQFISYDPLSATRRIVEKALLERGVTARPTFYSTSPSVILQLVLLNKGVAAVPYLIAKYYLTNRSIVVIGRPKPIIIERPISIIRRRNKLMIAPMSSAINRASELFGAYHEEVDKLYSAMR